MPGLGRPRQPGDIHQGSEPDAVAPPHGEEAFRHEGAIEPFEPGHVGDGTERHQVGEPEQIRLRPRCRPEAAAAQHSIDRHDGQEDEPDGGKMAEPGEIVETVRIDDRDRRRQFFVRLVVIDHDGIEAEATRLGERLETGGAAVDGDQESCPLSGKRPDRLAVRAKALEDAVGNMKQRIEAAMAEKPHQQRHRGGAVDVVIAEDRNALASHDRSRQTLRRGRHVGDSVGVRHQPPDARIEVGLDVGDLDAPSGDDARQQLRQVVALDHRHGAGIGALVQPVMPWPPGDRALDAEKQPARWPGRRHGEGRDRHDSPPARRPCTDSSPGTAGSGGHPPMGIGLHLLAVRPMPCHSGSQAARSSSRNRRTAISATTPVSRDGISRTGGGRHGSSAPFRSPSASPRSRSRSPRRGISRRAASSRR